MLISCTVTAQLFCDFVFAYVKSMFSHDAAHICKNDCLIAFVLLADVSCGGLESDSCMVCFLCAA